VPGDIVIVSRGGVVPADEGLLDAGSSPEKKELPRIRKKPGRRAAIAWRDKRFAEG